MFEMFWKTYLLCETCEKGKQVKTSFKPLELLHIDLFRPIRILSLGGKKYSLVIVDDYSRYTRINLFSHKHESFNVFEIFCKRIQNEKKVFIFAIRSDHSMKKIVIFTSSFHQGHLNKIVVERKNRKFQEMARTMLCKTFFQKHF
ncbi:hypothetical protein CR513_02012, partial [Mucuna pruriens]